MSLTIPWEPLLNTVRSADPLPVAGRVAGLTGLTVVARGLRASVGELCWLGEPGRSIPSEVVGFRDDQLLLMALGEVDGVQPGLRVYATGAPLLAPVGDALLGRVLDGLGQPIDGLGSLQTRQWRPVSATPPSPLERQRIREPLSLGVRALDGLLTCGRGQRLGIFAGSGVGKSTLLGMIARSTAADVNVIALVGERGREVREFLERDLGAAGMERSVVVVATSDQPALCRIKSALVATTIAEHFRAHGRDVLLMMDSLTRLAQSQREVGLAVGEPPATRGYTPSVFALLPRLLERAGTDRHGSITGLYTVLVDGDDMNEPVTDTARGILDGHVVLSRQLAERGHFPAIDVLQSVSRVMPDITDAAHQQAARHLRATLAIYRDHEDLISVGAYQQGSNPAVDDAVTRMPALAGFLQQGVDDRTGLSETRQKLIAVTGGDGR